MLITRERDPWPSSGIGEEIPSTLVSLAALVRAGL